MFLTSSILQLPASLKPHPSPFINGLPAGLSSSFVPSISSGQISPLPQNLSLTIQGMKKMTGRVVCDTNDKTVAVEVVRLAPHPKYKRRVRIKKKYQAHDPDNQFKVGDLVQLEKSRPISKTKAFVAVPPVTAKNVPKPVEAVGQDLGLPLQSQVQ